jgi:hypothetical protein
VNQEQVKQKLLKLDPTVEDFTVTFTGKKSKKVDGLYKPDSREILIHNDNFEGDAPLIYTAIHEFAHHVQFTRTTLPVSSKAHTANFWNIFHNLLLDAEKRGIYTNVFHEDERFIALTKKIKEDYIAPNGGLIREFGALLMEAHGLCMKAQASFDDYVDRELGLHRSSAKSMMKISARNVDPRLGYENMRTVASIRDEDTAKAAERAFLEGDSPDMVKVQYASRPRPDSPLKQLYVERDRIEKSLDTLTKKLAEIERRIHDFEEKSRD